MGYIVDALKRILLTNFQCLWNNFLFVQSSVRIKKTGFVVNQPEFFENW